MLGIFGLNAILLLVSAILAGVWQEAYSSVPGNKSAAWYIDWNWTGLQVGGAHALTYYILYTYMVPISLFVTIEISRLCQALFMYWDNVRKNTSRPFSCCTYLILTYFCLFVLQGMMSKENIRMVARNSNLNEDLGRVRSLSLSPKILGSFTQFFALFIITIIRLTTSSLTKRAHLRKTS